MVDTARSIASLTRLFDMLPAATEAELKEELPQFGAAILAVQKSNVAVRTGDLFRGLTVQVLNGGFKIRIGLIGLTSSTGKTTYPLFYGRFVEYGRRAQVVMVERRRRIKVRGRMVLRVGRGGRKRAEDIVSRYTLRVKPMAPRPFVRSPQVEEMALGVGINLATFWDRALARAGGGQ